MKTCGGSWVGTGYDHFLLLPTVAQCPTSEHFGDSERNVQYCTALQWCQWCFSGNV